MPVEGGQGGGQGGDVLPAGPSVALEELAGATEEDVVFHHDLYGGCERHERDQMR